MLEEKEKSLEIYLEDINQDRMMFLEVEINLELLLVKVELPKYKVVGPYRINYSQAVD